MREIEIAVIDPLPARRAELEGMILKSAGERAGLMRICHYSTADDCPRKRIGHYGAIFMTLNSSDDVAVAYRLRPEPENRWPLVVVTDYGRFSLEGHALWARHCLVWPPGVEQIAEALRRCLEPDALPARKDYGVTVQNTYGRNNAWKP